GVASMLCDDTGAPIVPGLQFADLAGGSLMAANAILAALVRREGRHLDISMTDGMMRLLSIHGANALCRGQAPRAADELLSGARPAYRYYRCGDGRYVAVGALEPKFWGRLCA